MSEIRRLAEVIGVPVLEGEQIDLDEILNQDVVIRQVLTLHGDYGEYVVAQVETAEGKLYRVACGGTVVVKKLQAAREYLPLIARFVRIKGKKGRSYYDIQ
jgi:hypothetical protein